MLTVCRVRKGCVFLVILLTLFFTGCKKKNLDQLLSQGRVEAAVKYCEDCDGTTQKECFAKIGAYFFEMQDFNLAAQYYMRAGDHTRVISCYLIANSMSDAESYYSQIPKESQKEGATLLAQSYYLRGNYTKAKHYYGLAGNTKKIKHIDNKIPAFHLLTRLDAEIQKFALSEARSKIEKIKETLKKFIYFDGYDEWRYGTKKETDSQAYQIFTSTHAILQEKVGTIYLEKINSTITTSSWNQTRVEELLFLRTMMNRLMGLIKSLDIIGSYRRTYTKYENMIFSTVKPGDSGFEATYKVTLEHAKGLLETENLWEKNPDPKLFADYINDFNVDGDVLDYIPGMLDNIQARIMELDSHVKNILKFNIPDNAKNEVKAALNGFIKNCNEVLKQIGKKEYAKANEHLMATYTRAKKTITDIEKTFKQ